MQLCSEELAQHELTTCKLSASFPTWLESWRCPSQPHSQPPCTINKNLYQVPSHPVTAALAVYVYKRMMIQELALPLTILVCPVCPSLHTGLKKVAYMACACGNGFGTDLDLCNAHTMFAHRHAACVSVNTVRLHGCNAISQVCVELDCILRSSLDSYPVKVSV